jgi:hypothetical protein
MFEKEFLFSCRIIAFMYNFSTVMAVFIALFSVFFHFPLKFC